MRSDNHQTTRSYDVRTIANWILSRANELGIPAPTNMAINKIVYFLYEKVLVEDGRQIFVAKIEAWEHGPVIRELYSDFKKFGDKPISAYAQRFSLSSRKLEPAPDTIDELDSERFSEIVDHYLPMTASTLRRISHQPNSPWFDVWTHTSKSNPGMEISPEVISRSFQGYKPCL